MCLEVLCTHYDDADHDANAATEDNNDDDTRRTIHDYIGYLAFQNEPKTEYCGWHKMSKLTFFLKCQICAESMPIKVYPVYLLTLLTFPATQQ